MGRAADSADATSKRMRINGIVLSILPPLPRPPLFPPFSYRRPFLREDCVVGVESRARNQPEEQWGAITAAEGNERAFGLGTKTTAVFEGTVVLPCMASILGCGRFGAGNRSFVEHTRQNRLWVVVTLPTFA